MALATIGERQLTNDEADLRSRAIHNESIDSEAGIAVGLPEGADRLHLMKKPSPSYLEYQTRLRSVLYYQWLFIQEIVSVQPHEKKRLR